MADNLINVLTKKRDEIVTKWVDTLKSLKDTPYEKRGDDELKEMWSECFDGYLLAIEKNDYQKISDFIKQHFSLTEELKFNLANIEKGILAFRESVWQVLRDYYKDDLAQFVQAIQEIDKCLNKSIYELARTYDHDVESKLIRYVEQIEQASKTTEGLPLTDGLTSLYSYSHFKRSLAREIKKAQRYRRSLSIVILDIDSFKDYNEAYGRPNGDIVIKQISDMLEKNSRDVDITSHYKGGKFIIALPETAKMDANIMAERIRKLVEDYSFSGEQTQPGKKLTISGGVSSYPDDGDTQEGLVHLAEKLMQQAKKQGHNQICFLFD